MRLVEGKIEFDRSDCLSLDQTLAEIIVSGLTEFRKKINGFPAMDVEDIPDGMDEEKAWEYSVDEMIWAFGNCEIGWHERYETGSHEHVVEELPDGSKSISFKPGDYKVDIVARDAHMARMDNGRRLFAKYFHSIWI